ncbi:hypothetical protein HQ576_09780 [bacterium]|nr:hypothetical protein [bacterium]
MRYRSTGQVHLDFHRTTHGTLAYLRKTYGQHFVDDLLRRVARDVYRSIADDLRRGDTTQLLEHWTYYLDREGGDYTVCLADDEVRLIVRRCPAWAYLRERGIDVDPAFCRQTVVLNEALAEGSPFAITTEVMGDGQCVQAVRRMRP